MPIQFPDTVPHRERCQMCHQVSAIGFWVPDHIWRKAVHRHWQNSILCLWCFVSQADEKLVPWDEQIQFFPVSLRTHLACVLEGAGQ